jgi:hypothetical protein
MTHNSNQYKFKEGEVHSFRITGFTEIPNTDESFFILENQFGGKHLLKSNPYIHYNLQINQELKCKIDKINCSGKIYLEPGNPIYKSGEIYDFDFIKIIDHINSVGEKEKAAIVKDQFGIELICSLPKDFKIDSKLEKLKCKVLRIKKGQLFLSHTESEIYNKSLQIGKVYSFVVFKIKQLEEQTDYYILKDKFDNSYSLKRDMYAHYGFKIGEKVECSVTKYNTDGHLKIEPIHPHYEIGKSYSFKYLRTIKDIDPLGKEENVIVVEDIYGVETKVRSFDSSKIKNPIPEYLNCKVDGIRKGKAILSFA